MTTQNRQKSNAKKPQIHLMDGDSYLTLTPWINSHSNSIKKRKKQRKNISLVFEWHERFKEDGQTLSHNKGRGRQPKSILQLVTSIPSIFENNRWYRCRMALAVVWSDNKEETP